ncbi:MAG: hypothetical protein L0Y79_08765 [Chlorobi bacterium]|nr:hypothetical protein [Chlorobiota bacterium]MCI0716399.1 hypothetical protein [Chlorobiota bacterium]
MLKTTLLPLSFFCLILVFSCGEEVNAPQDFISGTITFNDTNLKPTGGYYAVSLYGDSANPFTHPPIRSDRLSVGISNGVASSYYKVTGLASANYYVGSTWIDSVSGNISVYGVYGCDTLVNCTNPTKVTVPNFAGTGNISFRSRTR